MKSKVVFKSKLFEVGLLVLLVLLIVFNSYVYISGNEKAIIPIIIQIFIIILILSHHKYTKQVLKIWSGLFMILLPFIQLISQGVKFMIGGESTIDIPKIIKVIVYIILGSIIFYFTKETVEIIEDEKTLK